MRHFGNKDSHALHMFCKTDAERHIVAFAVKSAKVITYFVFWNYELRQVPLYTHIKHAVDSIHILIQIENITSILIDEPSDYGDNAALVRAVHTQNGVIMLLHVFFFIKFWPQK